MCRLAVYRGPRISLHQVIYSQPHNFVQQAQKPREMVAAALNGDGFGVGWYNPEAGPEPALLTSEKPLWHDVNLPRISGKIFSETIFMHVRAASPGLPVHQANSHPFQWGNELFMHNGIISEFRKGFMRAIREQITDPFYENLQGTTDSEHVFGLYLSIRQENPAFSMPEAMTELFNRLNRLALKFGTDLVLNLAVTDGRAVCITRYTNIEKTASLYFSDSGPSFPGGFIAASEKLNSGDSSWQEFPVNRMVTLLPDESPVWQDLPNPFFLNGVLTRKAKPTTLLA